MSQSGALGVAILLAVEKLLGAKVEGIRTAIAHGKVKRQGRYTGRRNDWKKAIVKLKPDQKIELFEQI